MLLQRLREYADTRLEVAPTLYRDSPVRYLVELRRDGSPIGRSPIDLANPSSPSEKRGVRHPLPSVTRSSGVKPLLLADKADYVLGFVTEGAKPGRVADCHAAFLDLLDRCAAATGEPDVAAVRTFLHAEPLSQLSLPPDFDAGATMTFRVHAGDEAVYPVDLPTVRAFWAQDQDPAARSAPRMQCLVCGLEQPVLERLQGKVKGVPGGQTSGTSLISANAPAFESYGLSASLIAPTCAACGESFTRGVNDLLAKRESRIILPGSAFIFWTRDDTEFSLLDFFDSPQPEHVQALFDSVRSGRLPSALDDTPFYAASLSGSGARTVVRDWIDTTIGNVKRRLVRWFERQRIVDTYSEPARPLGLYPLAAATVRDARKELSPQTPRALLHAALVGGPLPLALLEQAVRRNRAEQDVTRPRAALIKLVILSREADTTEDAMVHLNADHPNSAYHCGRLLAVLEEVQRAALGDVNATIVDRFYGTASTAPIAVFARLLRGAQPHLARLRKDRPAVFHALQQRLEDVHAKLDSFPRTLTLPEQGLFSLGYYHQRAYDRAQARLASERRKAAMNEPGSNGETL